MVCKLSNRINAKLEEMYNARFWFLTTIIHAIVFDANNFCHRISQLTQLTSPERFDEMKYVEQREESLQQIVSIPREESLPQIASGIYYHNAILQNLSEQDTCFDSKDLIDRERNAVDLYDQRDSKGQMSFISFKEECPKDHLQLARNTLNQLPVKFSANSAARLAPSNEAWNIGNRTFAPILVQLHALTAIQQLQRYEIVFRNVLASNQRAVVEEAMYIPLICYENFMWTKKQPAILSGVVGRSSRLPYAQQGLGSSLQHQMVATKSLRSGPLQPALKGAPMDTVYHSEIGTQHTMIEVMNHIKVQLKPTGRPEYTGSQDDECVTAMNSIPPGEIMCRVHIADQSDKAPATKGIEAWKYYRYNHYQGYTHVPNIVLSVNGLSASQLMTTTFSDGASQLLNGPPAKRFNESISQKQREESLTQVISGVYDHSNVPDDAIQDENRNPYVHDPGAQTLGIQKVVPCPDIPEAPASLCNIIHHEPINCESKQHLESPIAECDVDYLLKNQNAEVHRIRFPDQKGYWPPASPITTSPSPVQRQSRLFSTSRQPSSRKPKLSDSIGVERMRREEVKARHGRLRKGYGYHQWLGPGAM